MTIDAAVLKCNDQILIILQVRNLLEFRMMHAKLGGIPSRIKEVGTVPRCEDKPVAPNTVTTTKMELR